MKLKLVATVHKALSELMSMFEELKSMLDEHLHLDHLRDETTSEDGTRGMMAIYWLGKNCYLSAEVMEDKKVFINYVDAEEGEPVVTKKTHIDNIRADPPSYARMLDGYVNSVLEHLGLEREHTKSQTLTDEDREMLRQMGIKAHLKRRK